MQEPVEVVAYDPQWPAQFASLAERASAILAGLIVGVEHVGSTSVPDLSAKPIIDLDIVLPSRLMLPTVLERLASLGYRHRGDLGVPGREAFHWPENLPRHHLYVCSMDTPNLHDHLLLRDFLRRFPAEAQAYGELKVQLAAQFRHDRLAYSEAKTSFIQDALGRARRLSMFSQGDCP